MRTIPPDKIESWVAKYFEYKKRHGKNGPELVIANPFYDNDKKKFNISLTKATCHDWRGDENWAGPINPKTGKRNCSFVQFVKSYLKCSFPQAVRAVLGASGDVSDFIGPKTQADISEPKREASVALPGGVTLLASSQDKQAKPLIKWLVGRGYSLEDIDKFALYHFGMDVFWPYFEFDEFVYWQSRSRLNKRFNFPEGTDKGNFLYGFDDVEPSSYLIITESIFDKYTLGDQVLASGGANLTEQQVRKIKLLGPKKGVILSPDNDKAGLASITYNRNLLCGLGFPVFHSVPPKFVKDWNELITGNGCFSRAEAREIHDRAIKR